MSPKLALGWEEVERLVLLLAERLHSGGSGANGRIDRVVAVARGGLVPAVLLAARLGVRAIESVRAVHYDADRRLEVPRIVGVVPAPDGPAGDPRATLVVDDVLETGGTLRRLAETFPEARYAVLVAKREDPACAREIPCSVGVPGASVEATAAAVEGMARWVVFPWSDREER
jgi:hypoxanthine phosphoribosyltransferase